MALTRLALCLLVFSTALGTARAQELTEEQRGEARGLFDAGRAAFAAGRYEEALDYFERSYEITHLPDILYNIGHTAERVRHDERALAAFEEYVRLRPEAEERASIEARITTLRAALSERERNERAREQAEADAARAREASESATEDATEDGARPPAASIDRYDPSPAGWIVLGAGGAVAIAGAVLLGVASSRASEVTDAPEGTPWPDVRDAYADADTLAIAGAVVLGAGAAVMIAGAVWGAIDLSPGGGVEAAFGPGHVELRGTF